MANVLLAISGRGVNDAAVSLAFELAGASGTVTGVHVASTVRMAPLQAVEERRRGVLSRGGAWQTLVGPIADSLTRQARSSGADIVVLGAHGRSHRLAAQLARRGIALASPGAGMVAADSLASAWPSAQRRRRPLDVSARRRLSGAALGVALLLGATPVLRAASATPSSALLVYLLGTVIVALVGGLVPALVTGIVYSFAADYFFVQPLHRLTVRDGSEVLALIVFLSVAALVSGVVTIAAQRSREAARAGAQAETLSALSSTVVRGGDALGSLLHQIRASFGVTGVQLLQRAQARWEVVASDGETRVAGTNHVDLAQGLRLQLHGNQPLSDEDHRVLVAFAAHAGVLLEQRRFAEVEAAAHRSAEGDKMRSALLAAVSHDLRTPLAAAKASISGLLDLNVEWLPGARQELLLTADSSLDALTRLVDDLLDMSRLQAGVLPVHTEPVTVEDVIARVVPAGSPTRVCLEPHLPWLLADPELLARVLANLVQNAERFSPAVAPPELIAHRGEPPDTVELTVRDHGPGIPESLLPQAFTPFQRLDDRAVRDGAGVGLGLAIAQRLTEAMNGILVAETTDGGGLTLRVMLPTATVDVDLDEPA